MLPARILGITASSWRLSARATAAGAWRYLRRASRRRLASGCEVVLGQVAERVPIRHRYGPGLVDCLWRRPPAEHPNVRALKQQLAALSIGTRQEVALLCFVGQTAE